MSVALASQAFVDEHPTALLFSPSRNSLRELLVGSLVKMCDAATSCRLVRSAGDWLLVGLFAFWAGLIWLASRVGPKRPVLGGVLLAVFVLSLFALMAAGSPTCGEEDLGEPCYPADPNDRPGP